MITRDFEKSLTAWYSRTDRLPLLVRGARQVGKSWTIWQWGRRVFGEEKVLEINFEERPDYVEYFTKDHAAHEFPPNTPTLSS